MELEVQTSLHGFTVVSKEDLPEINGTAYVLTHITSGARLLYLANDDNNKSFSIAFKTPPKDSTGVFHILEHSVLCGSAKFPVKEPFVNLLKSSMQTFLNAMTFGDKTLYPVASTNDQDLENLTDVYMDAVLHPNIYLKKELFEQEGWHYEVVEGENGNKQLIYNGVVFNEMKGALSDPTSVLYDHLQAALFPDTPYRFESGGSPEEIPSLTYEEYLNEHRRHYRLDNSYITLYGNLDLNRMLGFLDENYLAPEAAKRATQRDEFTPRSLPVQNPVVATDQHFEMNTVEENSCLGVAYVIGHAKERRKIVATDILLDAIMGSNEAPLKRALLDANIAGDAQAFIADAVQQPFVVIQLRSLKNNATEAVLDVINSTLRELRDGALDHALLEASLSRAEFVMREADYGIADGVALSMAALCGWLYDDSMPTTYLKYEEDFRELRAALDTDYFENLIDELFIKSNHMAKVDIIPVQDDIDEEEAKLASLSSTLSSEEFDQIEAEVERLRVHQETPDSDEALRTLPNLSIYDIGDAPKESAYECIKQGPNGRPCIYHHCPTNGIAYVYRYFSLSNVSFEDLPYAAILGIVLGKLDTKAHSSSEIDTLANGKLGNLSFFSELFEDENDPQALRPMFVSGASALSENIDWLANLPAEIMLETRFDDTSKIKDTLTQRKIAMEQHFANAGHACAMARLASYYLPAGVVREQIGGVDFYYFLKELLEHFDERKEELTQKLQDVSMRLFARDNMTVSFTGCPSDYKNYWDACTRITSPESIKGNVLSIPEPQIRNEAFVVPSDVCYAAAGYDRRATGFGYSGAWQVASRAVSYDYLWNEVRVKGGAYGAGFQAARTGTVRFYSYRDPHFTSTLERFRGTPAWLTSYKPSQTELEGYIVATVSSFDTPLKPRALVRRQDGDYFGGRSAKDRIQTRDEMISCTLKDIKIIARATEAVLSKGALCAFGNKTILQAEASKAGLNIIELLSE